MSGLVNLDSELESRSAAYQEVIERIFSLIEGESDDIAVYATVVSELHNSFPYYHWTGFYRVVAERLLKIGPYQGGHGCLEITFDRGICGACARTGQTQFVPDVHAREDHIACASTTNSEIVVPVKTPDGRLLAVLDVDSDIPAAFDQEDRVQLERLCDLLGQHLC